MGFDNPIPEVVGWRLGRPRPALEKKFLCEQSKVAIASSTGDGKYQVNGNPRFRIFCKPGNTPVAVMLGEFASDESRRLTRHANPRKHAQHI